jgi:hypothetical protein
MYGKPHKGKHTQEGNTHRRETRTGGKHVQGNTYREIYTCEDTYRDIYALGDIFARGDTYAQGDTYIGGHMQTQY